MAGKKLSMVKFSIFLFLTTLILYVGRANQIAEQLILYEKMYNKFKQSCLGGILDSALYLLIVETAHMIQRFIEKSRTEVF